MMRARMDFAFSTADTARATPFALCAPEAACSFAARCVDLMRVGAVDDAREAAENALFLLETVALDEIAATASVAVGEALVALGDLGRARRRFEVGLAHGASARRAREGLELIRRAGVPSLRPSAGPRRAFDDF
jgi:hypothetical protein